jgi:putative methyltransferase (TIGR04325 family)
MSSADHFNKWSGVYREFAEVPSAVDAFVGNIWLQKNIERGRDALRKAEGNPSPLTETRDDVLPVVAAAMLGNGRRLRILDFGGGIGLSYLKCRNSLPDGAISEFVIVEKDAMCVAGRELLEQEQTIRFTSDLPADGEIFDIVHCGSSFHYVDHWHELLERFAAYCPKYILFSDLPAADNGTFVTAQNFHGLPIPVRFWNFEEFVRSLIEIGYDLVFKSRFRGDYLAPGELLPTENFDRSHRLEHFSQFVFRRLQVDEVRSNYT